MTNAPTKPENTPPLHIFPVTVRYHEAGPHGVMRLSALADWLQEAAGESATRLGFGFDHLMQHNVAWVLTRLALRITRMPRAGETIAVHTWPSSRDHGIALRGFELQDAAGATLATATTAWAVFDPAARKLAAMPAVIEQTLPPVCHPCQPFAVRTLPRLRDTTHQCTIIARRDDLDLNNHVNNARYMGWVLESLPDTTGTLRELDVMFRAECFAGETLTSCCAATDAPNTWLHSIRRPDATEAVRALTVWG